MRIMVVDGQGGGVGRSIIENLKSIISESDQIIALGTNSMATSAMMKSGAHIGATGENAIIYNSSNVDLIIGAVGIIAANSMLGELSPNMANAISSSNAVKVLIPINKCNLIVSSVPDEPLAVKIDRAMEIVKEILKQD